MTRPSAPSPRVIAAFAGSILIGAITFLIWWASATPPAPSATTGDNKTGASEPVLGPPRGGQLVGVARAAPIGFNPYVVDGDMREAIALLTQATLVRVNNAGDPEPWLAESWTQSADRLRITFKLRPKVLWSDGIALTADDVVFSVRAASDRQSTASMREQISIAGKPITAREVDPLTVEIAFPLPFAPGALLLERLPILPRHKLDESFAAGTFARSWPFTVAEGEVAGLGPFVLTSSEPDKVTFARNSRYWRKTANGDQLPYLDAIEIAIAGSGGDWDSIVAGYNFRVDESIHAGISANQTGGGGGSAQGLGFDALWFNLRSLRPELQWMADDRFRAAVAAAIDRRRYCSIAACDPISSPVSPANRRWFNPDLPMPRPDLFQARAILAEIGWRDTNGDGVVEDTARRPVKFEVTSTYNKRSEPDELFLIQRAMKDIGIAMDFKMVRENALSELVREGRYEAALARVDVRDADPAMNMSFWLSSGSAHVWNPSQPKPATEWERRIDEMMLKQASASNPVERVQLFADVQKVFVEHLPMIVLGARDIDLSMPFSVVNVTPSVLRPHMLWNADELAALKR